MGSDMKFKNSLCQTQYVLEISNISYESDDGNAIFSKKRPRKKACTPSQKISFWTVLYQVFNIPKMSKYCFKLQYLSVIDV